jgi:DNA-directed RNA polymerase I, II, and III subunit RPABC2
MSKEEFKVEVGPRKLTRFERAKIVGSRSLQISLGAPAFIKIPKDINDPIQVAIKELTTGSVPLSIRRTYPNGNSQNIPIEKLL